MSASTKHKRRSGKRHDTTGSSDTASRSSLTSLPFELLLEIHTYCPSPVIPTLCRHLHRLFSSASVEYRATYLIRVSAVHLAAHSQLERCVVYPLCTEPVYERILARQGLVWELNMRQRAALPRRFCKRLTADTPIDGLFSRLIDSSLFDVSGNRGYALARAVYVGHEELIDLLLVRGADASVHKNVAVLFAVRKKDAALVEKLFESESYREDSLPLQLRTKENRRLWLPDDEARVLIDEAMRVGAVEVVDYLASLGATPSMDALRLLT